MNYDLHISVTQMLRKFYDTLDDAVVMAKIILYACKPEYHENIDMKEIADIMELSFHDLQKLQGLIKNHEEDHWNRLRVRVKKHDEG